MAGGAFDLTGAYSYVVALVGQISLKTKDKLARYVVTRRSFRFKDSRGNEMSFRHALHTKALRGRQAFSPKTVLLIRLLA